MNSHYLNDIYSDCVGGFGLSLRDGIDVMVFKFEHQAVDNRPKFKLGASELRSIVIGAPICCFYCIPIPY